MDYPQYIQEGRLTPDGEKVKAFIEGLFVEADKENDLSKLNGLSGYAAYYYVNAYKGKGKAFGVTSEQWFEQFPTMANAAYRDMRYFENKAAQEAAQQEAVQQTQQAATALTEALEKLQAQVKEQADRLAALESENVALRKAKTRKPKDELSAEDDKADAEPPAEEKNEA